MLCVRCGCPNPGQTKLCGKCGAVLPRSAGESISTRSHDLHEGQSYEPPAESYPNDALDALEAVLEQFFEDEADIEGVEDKIQTLEERLSVLLERLPSTLEAVESQKEFFSDDNLPHQIGFLVKVGVQRFNDAIDELYKALEEEMDESIDGILEELALGNDYICHAAALMGRLLDKIDIALKHLEVETIE